MDKERLKQFAKQLEAIGVFPRAYEQAALCNLFDASKALYQHFCQLDTDNFLRAKDVTIADFANLFAENGGD